MPIADKSRALLWSNAPPTGLIFSEPMRNGMMMKVGITYDLGHLKDKSGRSGTTQKALFQSCRFKKGYPKEWPKQKDGVATSEWEFQASLLGSDDGSSDVYKFVHDWVYPLQDCVKAAAKDNSIAWFKKTVADSTINEWYTPMIKEPNDAKFSPTLKGVLPSYKGRDGNTVFKTEVYGPNKNKVTMEDYLNVAAHSEVVIIFELPSIFFQQKMYGPVRPQVQSLMFFPEDRLTGFSFVMDDPPAGNTKRLNEGEAEGQDDETKRVKVEEVLE